MSIARRLTFSTVLTVISLGLIAAVSVWGLTGLSRDLDVTLREYQRLREIYEVGLYVARAKAQFESFGDPGQVIIELERAATKLTIFLGEEEAKDDVMVAAIMELRTVVKDPVRPENEAKVAARFNQLLGQVAQMATAAGDVIKQTQLSATQKRQTSIRLVIIIAGLIIAGAFLVSVWQYASVMGPLRRLRTGVKRIAAGNFSDRLEATRGGEFADVAADFNNMAAQLDELYRNLEQKVREKSRELVRSERLASVGFLAAGVAHEINNPLSIVSGYAELSLRKLEQNKDNAKEEASRALQIICDETFRCKRIIEKLLSLARGGDEAVTDVSIPHVAIDVAEMVQGLPRYRNRTLEWQSPGAADGLTVRGNETELKQVLLNLTVNALEAAPPKSGRVVIEAHREGRNVVLSVSDNGKGMSAQTLARVFEPFYTEKRGVAGGDEEPGTGLGLAISHAIVTEHGGRITAESKGLGQGSRFTVTLPAAG